MKVSQYVAIIAAVATFLMLGTVGPNAKPCKWIWQGKYQFYEL